MQTLTKLVEELASSVAGTQADDLPALAGVHSALQSLRGEASKPSHGADQPSADDLRPVCQTASQAERVVEAIILRETKDSIAALEDVKRAVDSIQQMISSALSGGPITASEAPVIEPTPAPAAPPAAAPAPAPAATANDTQAKLEESDLPLVMEFVTEAGGHLESAEAALLKLDEDPADAESINTVFRAFHTIKGVAGFLNLKQIGLLAHAAETLLDLARKQQIQLTGNLLDIILESSDAMRRLVTVIEKAANAHEAPAADPMLPPLLERLEHAVKDPTGANGGETAPAAPVVHAKAETEPSAASQAATASPGDATIRISTERLDSLINMVGELVISQSMAAQDVTRIASGDVKLARTMGRLGKITRELQDLSMSMRMVPVHGVFQKMSRVVRDLCRKAGKQVDFNFTGGETELDRNVVEAIGDPLVHMVRNACDHGIEAPDVRVRCGKAPAGKLTLKAYHQAGSVVIEITDDGRGLNKSKILAKAVANGLIQAGTEGQLSEQEVFKLIFAAGLSTAEKITDISGRGVGMDVVRKNIEALRGRIDIASVEGQGSTFTIRLPLTLAVIDGLVVRIAGERYIIPILSVEQSLRPTASQISTIQNRGEMCMIRGSLLPLFRLYRLFNLQPKTEDATQGLVVIVQDNSNRCCLLVDELVGQQQVVIKKLGDSLESIKGVSGGAILGDGSISLILDVPGLVEIATTGK
jgi:two-component system chemotaxis sensor kinase CheA